MISNTDEIIKNVESEGYGNYNNLFIHLLAQ